MKSKSLLFTLLIIVCFDVSAQFHNFHYVPPTPDVSALNKFTEIPVSHFSGVPEINVPLHTIELRDVKIPITLSYHSGGIKVEEVASNTGLGWAISGGGNISTSIAGTYDLGGAGWANGSYPIPQNREMEQTLGSVDYNMLMDITASLRVQIAPWNKPITEYDTEPDMFYFSFPGKSGKFMLTQNGIAHVIPYDTMKIERPTGTTFSITDAEGNVYQYDRLEEIRIKTRVYGNGVLSDLTESFNYTYYLKKIITRYGEIVDYYYEKPLTYEYQVTESYNRHNKWPDQYGCPEIIPRKTTIHNQVTGALLTRIVTNRGDQVTFDYSSCERLDLPGTYALNSVVINEGDFNTTFSLAYTYYGLETNNGVCHSLTNYDPHNYRLKLISVTQDGIPPYRFDYNIEPLPNRFSYAQDHWGYYNGKVLNTSLVPVSLRHGFYDGGNREPSEQHMKAGVLERIFHPTGGSTRFAYEPHKYFLTYEPRDEFFNKAIYAGDASLTRDFTIGAVGTPAFVRVRYNATLGQASPQMTFTLSGPGYLTTFNGQSEWQNISLAPGEYHLTTYTQGTYEEGFFNIEWVETYTAEVAENRIIGGLRVKEINYDPDDGTSTGFSKYFRYQDPSDTAKSSGKLLLMPEYGYHYFYHRWDDQNSAIQPCNYNAQSSGTTLPLTGIQGSHIGYPFVRESYNDAGKRGSTLYEFSFRDDLNHEQGYPFVQPVSFDWMRGRPLYISYYNYNEVTGERLVKKEKFYYKDLHTEFEGNLYSSAHGNKETQILGLKIYPIRDEKLVDLGWAPPYVSPAMFSITPLKFISAWSYLEKKEDTMYADTNSQPITTILHYFYDNDDIQLDSIIIDDVNIKRITRYSTPGDFARKVTNTSSFIYKMKTKHILSDPIESMEIVRKNNVDYITTSKITLFDSFNDLILPKTDYFLDKNTGKTTTNTGYLSFNAAGVPAYHADYQPEFQYTYDPNGNVLSGYNARAEQYRKIVYGGPDFEVIAYADGSTDADICFSSFEVNEKGNWNYTGTISSLSTAKTGSKYYNSTSAISSTVAKAASYKISLWARKDTPGSANSTIAVNGQSFGVTSSVWTYYERTVTLAAGAAVSVTPGSGVNVDDLRLHAADATMTSFTFREGIGVESTTDPNNQSRYYHYDNLGRLEYIRDDDGNIVEVFKYHYKGNN